RTRRTRQAVESIWNQRTADDDGVSRRSPAGGNGARRLPLLEQRRPYDPRVRVGIFNHVSMYFSDVVWNGLSTQYVRQGFSGNVSQDELRRYWSVISPASFLERMRGRDLP